MLYVILDPCVEYAAEMMVFVARHGLEPICVFTQAGLYGAFKGYWSDRIGVPVRDEYLMPEWPSMEALGAQIRRDHPGEIHGIIPWDEMSTFTGALLSQAMGLDWNPPEVMRCFRNKFAMKDALRRSGGVRINQSRVVEDLEQVREFQEVLGKWPVVVKPTEGAGSRGVVFAQNLQELSQAAIDVFHATQASGEGQVLLEEFLEGPEFVVNGITDGAGELLATDVWLYDKRDFGSRRNLYVHTEKISTTDPRWGLLDDYATQVVRALGLRRAPVHMEVKLDDQGPCLVEVGARFAGGNQPRLSSELHGRSLFELAACHYLSDTPLRYEDVNYHNYDSRQARIVSGVQLDGIEVIHAVYGVNEVSQLPSFYDFGFTRPVGAPCPATVDLLTKAYEVYLIHEDPEVLERDSQLVREWLQYEGAPLT